jgi:drug/metabolite transporter (DMT)-like permease
MLGVNSTLAIKFALKAAVSPSVIMSFLSMTSFFVAVAFYFLFKEKLTIKHVIGMALIIASIVIIAVAKSQADEIDNVSTIDYAMQEQP